MTDEQATTQAKAADSEKIGGYTGLGAGILTGAKIGTVVFPVAGLGTFAGAVVGGVVGNEVGKRIGRGLMSGASAFAKTVKDG